MSKAILARIYAEEIAKNMLLVYWTEEGSRRDFHLQNAHEAMNDLADALGYEIKKREEP
jgi:hypothetical protein